jgi:hypothetical protein
VKVGSILIILLRGEAATEPPAALSGWDLRCGVVLKAREDAREEAPDPEAPRRVEY